MPEDLISVIVPVFNAEKFLAECIESVINQSYRSLEIILVNDGSTDGSLNICRYYQRMDSRIKIIDKVNEGVSLARSTGIFTSNGKYFATVDADDVLDKDFISKMYQAIIHYHADICLCARKVIDGNKEENVFLDRKALKTNQITKKKLLENYALYSRIYHMSDAWDKLYRREFVERTGAKFYLDKKYNGGELLFNHLLLFHQPRITATNTILYSYRIVPNSRVRRKDKPLQQGFHFIIRELLAEADKCNFDFKIKEQLCTVYISLMKYVTLDIVMDHKDWKDIRQKFKIFFNNLHSFILFRYMNQSVYKYVPKRLWVFYFIIRHGDEKWLETYYRARECLEKCRFYKRG